MATKQTEASRKYQNKVGLISLNDTPFLEGRSTIISSSNKPLYIQYVVTRFPFFVHVHNYNIIWQLLPTVFSW